MKTSTSTAWSRFFVETLTTCSMFIQSIGMPRCSARFARNSSSSNAARGTLIIITIGVGVGVGGVGAGV